MKRYLRHCLLVAGLLLGGPLASPAVLADGGQDPDLVQAAYVFNFVKFTTWPAPPGEEALRLCLAGDDVLSDALAQLAGRKLRDREVIVESIEGDADSADCHVLYVARSRQDTVSQVLAPVRHHPVLSISQLPGFVGEGGIIELYRSADRVRFRINLAAARRAGLQLSSRLLRLADIHAAEDGE